MPRLRSLSGQQVRAILEAHGFLLMRQSGSHMILRGQGPQGMVSVPVPNHKEVSIGTLGSIISLSGVPRSEFEA